MISRKLVVCTLVLAINSVALDAQVRAANPAKPVIAVHLDQAGAAATTAVRIPGQIASAPKPAPARRTASATPGKGPMKLLAEYEVRLAERKFDAVEPLISKSAVFWFNDGSFSGLPAIRAAFEESFAAFPLERYWVDQVSWIAVGPKSAACVYRFHWTAHTPDGDIAGGGRGTTVMRRERDGWKIVHVHLSQEPDPASAVRTIAF